MLIKDADELEKAIDTIQEETLKALLTEGVVDKSIIDKISAYKIMIYKNKQKYRVELIKNVKGKMYYDFLNRFFGDKFDKYSCYKRLELVIDD